MVAAAPVRSSQRSVPKFAFVQPLAPKTGLLWSALIHALAIAATGLSWRSHETSPRPREVIVIEIPANMLLTSARLPGISFSGATGSPLPATKSGGMGRRSAKSADSSAVSATPATNPLYAGPQEIVSTLPDATNNVQTIRRPDLIAPPKLKFPIRLQSMLSLPASPAPVLAPSPQPAKPAETGVESKAVPAIEKPVLPVPVAAEQPPSSEPEAAKDSATSTQPAATTGSAQTPAAASIPQPQDTGTRAVIILNAVAVPPDTPALVPDAEISGNFAVAPANITAAATTEAPEGSARGSGTGSGEEKGSAAGEGTSQRSGRYPGNGSSLGETRGTVVGGSGGTGSGRDGNGREAAGTGGGAASKGPGSGGIPGISIAGGNGGGRLPSRPRTRPGYGITIISGGRSGGAIRDLGTFGRNEVVYTVYIPMSDAGGGPDWPMQYAVADPVAAGNGLVSPPLTIKKVAAEGPSKTPLLPGNRIFLSGMITVSGQLRELRPLRPQENGSQIAMDALQQWQFTPAEVNGQAVEAKVLIGVTIINPSPRNSAAEGAAASPHR